MNMLTNLTKAAVSVVLAPVALVVDLVTLPASSMSPYRGVFDRTRDLLANAGDCVIAAITPDQKESH